MLLLYIHVYTSPSSLMKSLVKVFLLEKKKIRLSKCINTTDYMLWLYLMARKEAGIYWSWYVTLLIWNTCAIPLKELIPGLKPIFVTITLLHLYELLRLRKIWDKNWLLKSCRNLYLIAQRVLRNREYVSAIHINHVLFPTLKLTKVPLQLWGIS